MTGPIGWPDFSVHQRTESMEQIMHDQLSNDHTVAVTVTKISMVLLLLSPGKGADPKSAVGTAFSFSRPKRQASAIANISRVLQFASKRFVNSFLNL
jgi:hypothetical protein